MTPDPEPRAQPRGRHARPDDEPPAAGATRAGERPPKPGSSIGHHPAGFTLLLGAGLITALPLVAWLLDRLDFDIAGRAAGIARSAAGGWPFGGAPWFWPPELATVATAAAVLVLVLALTGVRLPDVLVLGLALLLAVATAPAAWVTVDVVNSRLWELLTVCLVCVAALGLAITSAARFRSGADGTAGGAGGAAGVVVGGWVLVLVVLLAGSAIATSAETNAGHVPGPPQNLPGLLSVRAADAPRVDDLEGRWAAQLAAAEIDDDDAATAFAAQHHQLDSHLPVLLARGDDLGAPELDDETWLTVLDQPFGSRTEAARWCAGNGVAGCTPLLVTG